MTNSYSAMTHTPSPTVIEEARKMAAANVLRHLALIHGGEQGWMREAAASILRGGQDSHPEVLAFIAAIELGERRAEAAVVGMLEDTDFGDDELDTASLVFAGMIERGDHRSKP